MEGNSVFTHRHKIQFKFIHKIFDITNGSTDQINSWIFQNRIVDFTSNEGLCVKTFYNKFLLAFWSKNSEFAIHARIADSTAIQFNSKRLKSENQSPASDSDETES